MKLKSQKPHIGIFGRRNIGKSSIINALTGQKMATLVSAHQEAGHYAVTWDASGSASGIYFYRLEAGELVETKTMALIR